MSGQRSQSRHQGSIRTQSCSEDSTRYPTHCKSAKLPVHSSVFADEVLDSGLEKGKFVGNIQLLADSSASFPRTGILQLDGLDEIGDSSKVELVIIFTGKTVDQDGDGGKRLLLYR